MQLTRVWSSTSHIVLQASPGVSLLYCCVCCHKLKDKSEDTKYRKLAADGSYLFIAKLIYSFRNKSEILLWKSYPQKILMKKLTFLFLFNLISSHRIYDVRNSNFISRVFLIAQLRDIILGCTHYSPKHYIDLMLSLKGYP